MIKLKITNYIYTTKVPTKKAIIKVVNMYYEKFKILYKYYNIIFIPIAIIINYLCASAYIKPNNGYP